ncbi:MAG: tRNA pseudouridine(55) synthase TruB [Gammaproteobacteria bacterium]|nr:tRNA pseudouridine(55) synthase TruB [Gammaproteobacteria bacterium]
MKTKIPFSKISGILLLDKPIGLTSNAALQRTKYLFQAKKAGHSGSLDPLATGMLPICFGEATKMSQFLLDSDKIYCGTATLGIKTTTGDTEGEVISTRAIPALDAEKLTEVFQPFLGTIEQIPPMFSAIKHQGQPLYALARRGIEVERQARKVKIHTLKLLALTENTFDFEVHCSKGTYIRTLIEDIGEALGCGAHVSALRRTAVIPYQQQKMMTLEALEQIKAEQGLAALMSFLLPVDTCVQHLPSVKLSSSATFYMRTGQAVMVPHLLGTGFVRMFADDGRFMGIGEMTDDGRVAPQRLVHLQSA